MMIKNLGLRAAILILIVCLCRSQWQKIQAHIQDNFIVATSGDVGVYFQDQMDSNGASFKVQIRNLTTDEIMWRSDPCQTPINLKHRVSQDFARLIQQGYWLNFGYNIYDLNVTNIRNYKLVDENQTLKMYVETNEMKGYSTIVLFKLKIKKGCVKFSLEIINSATRVNHITWGFQAHTSQEGLYGFGQRFVPEQNKRGRRRFYTWPQQGGFGAGTELRLPKGEMSTYMPIPFFLSSATGWGYYVNTTYLTAFDLDQKNRGYYNFIVEAPSFELIFYTGTTPAQSLGYYTQDTGRSLIPPLFQFGPWNMFYNEFANLTHDNTYDNAIEAWKRFIDLDIPSSVSVDETRFLPIGEERYLPSKMKNMNKVMKELGLYTTSYINCNVDIQYEPLYEELAEANFLVRRNDGSLYTYFYSGAASHGFQVSMIDFSNPDVIPFWQSILQRMIDAGFNGWMYDYAQYIDPDNVFRNGLSGRGYHNKYPLDYQKAAFDKLVSLDPERVKKGYAPQYFYYVRSGGAGTQGTTWAQWTGDPSSDFTKHSGLPGQLSGMLSAGLSGIPFMGSDIGGFVWTFPPGKDLWIRWTQLGTFSGSMHTQTHGTPLIGMQKSHIHDWPEGTYAWRKNAKLRTQLLPYIYDAAHLVRETGLPMMRHLLLNYPQDKQAIDQDFQFMFGDKILVAPVVESSKQGRNVYLPQGDHWYFLNGDGTDYRENDGRFTARRSSILEGGQSVYRGCLHDDFAPAAVKAGSVIPLIDATVDTIRDNESQDVVSLSERKQLLYLWGFANAEGEIPFQVADGVHFEMKKNTKTNDYNSWTVTFKDQKKGENRVIVMQIVLNQEDFEKYFIGISKGTQALDIEEMWNIDFQAPGKGSLVYKMDSDSGVLSVRFGGRSWRDEIGNYSFEIKSSKPFDPQIIIEEQM